MDLHGILGQLVCFAAVHLQMSGVVSFTTSTLHRCCLLTDRSALRLPVAHLVWSWRNVQLLLEMVWLLCRVWGFCLRRLDLNTGTNAFSIDWSRGAPRGHGF